MLAYSTISATGIHVPGARAAATSTAGVYHMIMHAFFKALLFLAAGSVIHALHNEQNMKRMGRAPGKYSLPIT